MRFGMLRSDYLEALDYREQAYPAMFSTQGIADFVKAVEAKAEFKFSPENYLRQHQASYQILQALSDLGGTASLFDTINLVNSRGNTIRNKLMWGKARVLKNKEYITVRRPIGLRARVGAKEVMLEITNLGKAILAASV